MTANHDRPGRRTVLGLAIAAAVGLGMTACTASSGPDASSSTHPSPNSGHTSAPGGAEERDYGQNAGQLPASSTEPFQSTVVATLNSPWGIAPLPNGDVLVTEHRGRLLLITPSGNTSIAGVPAVSTKNVSDGLLNIALSPAYANDSTIYFTYASGAPQGTSVLTLARARIDDMTRLSDVQVLWQGGPGQTGGSLGGAITFDPTGTHVLLTAGDRELDEAAQNLNEPYGKIIRLNLDGSVPADNPFADRGAPMNAYWAYGFRNPYGLVFTPDGRLWEHEAGPRGGDELNLIQKGGNYGWSLVSWGDDYSGSTIPNPDTRPDLDPPALYWSPTITPSGMAVYSGDEFPEWSGSLLVGGLNGRCLVRIAVNPEGEASQADRWDMGQRIRNVAVAADGSVWVLEDGSQGRLLRLESSS